MKSLYYIVLIVIVLAIIWILYFANIIPQSFLVYTTTISVITTLMALWIEILRYHLRNKQDVYLSYSYNDQDTADQLANNIKGVYVVNGTTGMNGGESTDLATSKKISHSFMCFVLLGDKVTPAQKYEIKEMLKKNKRIIPILKGPSSKIPYNLCHVQPVLLDDFIKGEYHPLE